MKILAKCSEIKEISVDKLNIFIQIWCGKNLSFHKVIFTNWDRNEPDNEDNFCVGMKPSGFWSSNNCQDEFTR